MFFGSPHFYKHSDAECECTAKADTVTVVTSSGYRDRSDSDDSEESQLLYMAVPIPRGEEDSVQDKGGSVAASEDIEDGRQEATPSADIECIKEATPLPKWQNSKAKARLISELSDSVSDIHLYLGEAGKDYGKGNWRKVNFDKIKEKFVDSRWDSGNYRESLKRLLLHYIEKTGPFMSTMEVIEPWYTSPGNVSPAYALLFSLMMKEDSMKRLESMTIREIWESCDEFQKYDFDKFTGSSGYVSNMKNLTSKRKSQIMNERAAFDRDKLVIQTTNDSGRGYPKWNKHPASNLLYEDEKSGRAKELKPKRLWESRTEYQDFPLSVFRKHVYQERMARLAAPYWQHKRNQNAKKMYEKSRELIRGWKAGQLQRDVEDIIQDWGRMNLDNDAQPS